MCANGGSPYKDQTQDRPNKTLTGSVEGVWKKNAAAGAAADFWYAGSGRIGRVSIGRGYLTIGAWTTPCCGPQACRKSDVVRFRAWWGLRRGVRRVRPGSSCSPNACTVTSSRTIGSPPARSDLASEGFSRSPAECRRRSTPTASRSRLYTRNLVNSAGVCALMHRQPTARAMIPGVRPRVIGGAALEVPGESGIARSGVRRVRA